MDTKEIDDKIKNQLLKLKDKYDPMGQNLSAHLDGLLHSNYLTYWDYIRLDTLLSLQNPRTSFPDEKIFILYHQITELYFKMILNEMEQMVFSNPSNPQDFLLRIKRINKYLNHVINSFDVMIDGMDIEQFSAFRMALIPSSGFQSVQYRCIEIYATDFKMLISEDKKMDVKKTTSIEQLYQNMYWKKGATETNTGKKTLTLQQFDEKYGKKLTTLAKEVEHNNLRKTYLNHFVNHQEIEAELKLFDQKANVHWPLQHLKSAMRYLSEKSKIKKATGGTNWKKYLPPNRQKIIFYPELWTASEIKEWGKF